MLQSSLLKGIEGKYATGVVKDSSETAFFEADEELRDEEEALSSVPNSEKKPAAGLKERFHEELEDDWEEKERAKKLAEEKRIEEERAKYEKQKVFNLIMDTSV